MSNKFYLFIDESGDHGLSNIDEDFPVFLLCGVLFSADDYNQIKTEINDLKNHFWKNKEVILHSRDIRKCNKEFQILFDENIKKAFYLQLNRIIENSTYNILSSAINKKLYIEKYGKLSDDVYEIALSFIIERTVFCLDEIKNNNKDLHIVIEKRGKKEDKKLDEHFQKLLSRGTGFVEQSRLKELDIKIEFKGKKENSNGLQLADLIAYPIARYCIEPKRANPSFELIEPKIYTKNGKKYGLKKFP